MRVEAVAERTQLGRGELAAVGRLAWPAVAHMALVAATFVGDRAILGRDAAALAALHLPSTVVWCLTSLLGSLGVAAVALVGRQHGARRFAARDAAVQASLSLGARLGLAAVPLGLALGLALATFVAPALRGAAATYLFIAIVALPAAGVEAAAAAALQAMGDTRTPLVAAAAGALVHLAICAGLAAAGHGLAGAALGTVVGFAVAAVGCLRALGDPLPSAADELAHARVALWRLLGPTAGERLGFHAGYLAYAATIAGLGYAAMAANQALLAFEALAYPVAEGCGIAAAALTAQRLGEGDGLRARHAVVVAISIAVGLLAIFGSLVLLAPDAALGWLTGDDQVAEVALRALPWLGLSQPAMAFAIVGAMAIRGAGATRSAMGITLAGTTLRVVLTIALAPSRGLEGAWIASAADWLFQGVAVGWLLTRRPTLGASPGS